MGDDAENASELGRVQELLARFNAAAPGAWDERDAPIDPEPRRVGWEYAEPITIADNVWLGAFRATSDITSLVKLAGKHTAVMARSAW